MTVNQLMAALKARELTGKLSFDGAPSLSDDRGPMAYEYSVRLWVVDLHTGGGKVEFELEQAYVATGDVGRALDSILEQVVQVLG